MVPHAAVIVCVEDDLWRHNFYLSRHRMPDAYLCHDPADAVELIDRIKPTWLFLDHDLALGVDSIPIAEHLAATNFSGEIVITSENPFGIERLKTILPRAIVAPFSTFEIVRSLASIDQRQ